MLTTRCAVTTPVETLRPAESARRSLASIGKSAISNIKRATMRFSSTQEVVYKQRCRPLP
jgi:hypothetical protein